MFLFLFVVQMPVFSQEITLGTAQLNPHSNVNPDEGKISLFREKYDVICLALLIYKLDAGQRFHKNEIAGLLEKEYGAAYRRLRDIQFDFEHFGRKGWTRFYPFSLNGQSYIVRIFRTDERTHQMDVPVLFEAAMDDTGLTFQILPGLGELLKPCAIRRQNDYLPSPAATCP
ncbi:MAG: hypothetical protein PHS37_09130 [Candidatus Omnitrophica bacterium]|nr:hypothetical protein [Candidatus Omnitrophota bacterium]